tara:strand:+ start:39 stop:347 length:309 start_codon:yes stop_codon:yes gene_type:complete
MTYPTPEDVINKMIELKTNGNTNDDLDDFVYETISEWDEQFEDDEEWSSYSEDEDDDDMCNDIKDQLRDRVMMFLEDEEVELKDLKNDFLTKEKVIEALASA